MLTRSQKRVCAAQSTANQNVGNCASPALQNHLVLERIISFLSVSDLKHFRLVSQTWNKESLSTIRNKVYSTKFSSCTRAQITRYLELINNRNTGFPCVDFKMTTYLMASDQALFNKALKAISSFVKELHLDINHYEASIKMGKMKFPNLKTLKMCQDDWDDMQTRDFLKLFRFMIRNTPVLEKIDLKIEVDEDELGARFVKAIGTNPNFQSVTELSLAMDVPNNLLLELGRVGLRLKKLHLDFHLRTEFKPDNFKACMQSQSNSLEELILEKWDYIAEDEPVLQFPRMEKLKVLSFKMSQADVTGISFSDQFPALKHLKIKSYFALTNGKDEVILHRNMQPLDTLESLLLPTSFDDFEILDQAARIFPMVKKLEIGESRAVSRAVGIGMKNLEELLIHLDVKPPQNVFSELLTGYGIEELETAEETWSKCRKLKLKQDGEPAEIFQQLKVLRVYNGKLTDILCLLGPMKMGSLECLDLRQSPDSLISQGVLEQMQKKFKVLIRDECVVST